jgi:hypothetical protein
VARSAVMFATMTQPQLTCQDFDGSPRRPIAFGSTDATGLHDGVLAVNTSMYCGDVLRAVAAPGHHRSRCRGCWCR